LRARDADPLEEPVSPREPGEVIRVDGRDEPSLGGRRAPGRNGRSIAGVVVRTAKNAALVAGFTAVGFALGETVTRLAFRETTVLFPRYHTAYNYGRYKIRGIRPNSKFRHTSVDGSWEFVTNSRGFRNTKEFGYAKPPGNFRVLCLGDSHTQGYEVRQEATFSAALERYLEARGMRAEVLNTGVSGFSTAEALVFLENEGVKYDPDAVVLGFSANDYEDNWKAGLFGLDAEGRLKEQKTEHVPGVSIQDAIYGLPGVHWLSENSYLYSLLFNGVWSYFKARLEHEGEDRARAVTRGPDPEKGGPFEHVLPTVSEVSREQAALAVALIERMGRFCKQRGITLVVVDIPSRTKQSRIASSLRPALRSRMEASAIDYIDSRSSLGVYDGVAELHVPHGHHHISQFTHTILAVAIGQRLLYSEPEYSQPLPTTHPSPQ
jgi:GDSL-like Lipase/Acylhydrolase family